MTIKRAYSLLTIKAMDDDKREIAGVATTPSPDQMNDVVEPKGAEFKLPIPLLWQHDATQPIGEVYAAKVTAAGIEIKARIIKAAASEALVKRLDEAWESIKLGLVRGLSIGFRALEYNFIEATGGIRFEKWLWLELSAVTIPANQEASITAIKSVDLVHRAHAATGSERAVPVVRSSMPGVPGAQRDTSFTPRTTMNIREQIQNFQNKRAAIAAKCEALMAKAAEEGRSLDETEQQEYDEAATEIKAVDRHLDRLADHEKMIVARATTVVTQDGGAAAARTTVAAGDGVIRTNKNLPKGTAFTRYAMALMVSKGNVMQAIELAKQWDTSTPEVGNVLRFAASRGSTRIAPDAMQHKAAVSAGTVADATWASPLVQYDQMASEFIELLRPATIIGRVQGFRRVPFYVRIPRQTAGVSGSFVGEGAPKPVDSLAFDSLTMEPYKAAVIVVMTQELVRFSNPSAEALVREDMIRGVAQYLDERFIDPQYVGNSSSPASITNTANVTTATASTIAGTDAAVESAMATFISSNIPVNNLVWLMSPTVALSLSLKRTTQDEMAYPGLNVNGGTWYGLPVITSNSVALAGSPTEAYIVLMDPTSILLADDGGIDIDMSTEASVQMNDAPSAGAQSLVSLWQNNLVGLRAEKYINWKLRRANAVSVIRYNLSPSAV